MNKIFLSIIFALSFSARSEECSSSIKSKISKAGVQTLQCQLMEGLIEDSSVKHVLVIKDEGMEGRGIGVEIFHESDFGKAIFQDYGLGQVLGHFMLNSKKSNLFVKDIDNDGINEFGFNVLNERTALFFLYHFNKKEKKFKEVDFKRKVKGEVQTMNRLVSSIDFPIEIDSDQIKVPYEKDKYFVYKLIDGNYYSDQE
jgi:hypothetical protein